MRTNETRVVEYRVKERALGNLTNFCDTKNKVNSNVLTHVDFADKVIVLYSHKCMSPFAFFYKHKRVDIIFIFVD